MTDSFVPASAGEIGARLSALLREVDLPPLTEAQIAQFESYYTLLVRWNARINLTAIRDREGILSRHFVESIACACSLPAEIASLLDFGSGGGFPGVPIAICRPDIRVTLAESQVRKAAFLQEVVRSLGMNVRVHAGRAETLPGGFDCVTLRAVDQMEVAVTAASRLVRPGGWLGVMTTRAKLPDVVYVAGDDVCWATEIRLPSRGEQIIAFGQKKL